MEERKFTIGHLELRKLTTVDMIILSVFAAIDLGRLYFNLFSYPEMYKFFYDLGFAYLILANFMGSFPMRFTNFIFSITWFILSLLYIIEGDRALSAVSLSFFLLYHLVRYYFRKKYRREFIPAELGKGWYMNSYNQLEGRSGDKADAK